MNARIALLPAALAGLLAAAGCSSSKAPSASVPAGPSSPAPTFVAGAPAAPVSINGTLVDCGPGRQALVQQVNGLAAVSCVGGAPAFAVEPPLLSQPIGLAAGAPVTRTVYEEPAYRPRTVPRRAVVASGRSWKKSAAIIGGSTAAGAGVGALLDGGSGAKKGAVVGLVGGTIYDLATRAK
jgi:hypothetical protein